MLLIQYTNFSIHSGEIFALIGENGSGKTTLLRHLIQVAPPHLSLGYLPQEIPFVDKTAREYLEEGQLRTLEHQMASALEQGHLDAWSHLHEQYEHLGGYRRLPMEKVLRGLKLDLALLDLPMSTLSSGQRVRVALAKALMENPDLLLLDEPTNHLDGDMLSWLEKALIERQGATVVVSHDRQFLNATCNRLIEIRNGTLSWYGGNYDFYLEEQARLLERQIRAYEEQQEERARLKQKIKALTFSKKKPSPPKDRNFMAYDKRGEKHQKAVSSQLDDLKGRLEELEKNPLPHPLPKTILGMRFAPIPLHSPIVMELGDRVVVKGDRIVITGPNGCGKTTLMRRMLLCLKSPGVKLAYLDQEVALFPPLETPLSYFERVYRLSEEALRRELHKAALGGGELLHRPFSNLSVGMRKRMALLTLMLEKPNLLLLDEPTNHLDMLTLEAFEKALLQFEGAIVAISHDSTFMNKIATVTWTI